MCLGSALYSGSRGYDGEIVWRIVVVVRGCWRFGYVVKLDRRSTAERMRCGAVPLIDNDRCQRGNYIKLWYYLFVLFVTFYKVECCKYSIISSSNILQVCRGLLDHSTTGDPVHIMSRRLI